jgi:DivIVA domain-containing protein
VTYAGRVDRDAIERHDFPVGRKGYDPAAVDAHLRSVADELEALRERAGAGGPDAGPPAPRRALSAGASEQVRLILEAAEASAAELREQAGREAGDHVARVEAAAGAMRERLDGLQRELDRLLDGLRRSGEMLEQGLARLREEVSEVGGSDPVVAEGPVVAEDPVVVDDAVVAGATFDPDAVPEPAVVAPDAPAAPASNGAADEAGARLTALNMALGGTPREETAAYLAEHYAIADPEALLDDVYKRAGA